MRSFGAVLALSTLAAGFGACDCGGSPPAGDAATDAPTDTPPCTTGVTRCSGDLWETCSAGVFGAPVDCGSLACDDSLGCVTCRPAAVGACDGDTARYCRQDGSGYDEEYCDPLQGVACSGTTGRCVGACARVSLADTYIGCEYYPTVLPNMVDEAFEFAVIVANESGGAASVRIEGGELTEPIEQDVPDDGVLVQRLPWVPALFRCADTLDEAGCSTGARVVNGAYHLRSTRPVTVYQFSPLDYTNGGTGYDAYAYSNDASLLLPVTVWGDEFFVASYPADGGGAEKNRPSVFAVTGGADDTTVTITASIGGNAGGAGFIEAGVPSYFRLDTGDVLLVVSMQGDLTGSRVQSSADVQVIGGHYCTFLPTGFGACDHIEETMLPVRALSTTALVAPPASTGVNDPREEVVRIIATAADTHVTFDPAIDGVETAIAEAGGSIELERWATPFYVSADQKILVAQYMEGRIAAPGNVGDPSLSIAVPIAQYRTSYVFHAPTNYDRNYVNVTAPTGATVTIDGVAVTNFETIGASGYDVGRVELPIGAFAGNHSAESTVPFGITVYGYGFATSYWYPGGLELRDVPIR